jgi:hypothetical protein
MGILDAEIKVDSAELQLWNNEGTRWAMRLRTDWEEAESARTDMAGGGAVGEAAHIGCAARGGGLHGRSAVVGRAASAFGSVCARGLASIWQQRLALS